MCHYITATMAPHGDESAVRRIAKLSLLRWEPLDNPGVCKQLLEGEKYFFTTRGMCDCGTEIGALQRMDGRLPPLEPDLTRQIKKLKKKGWSDLKIERWVEQTRTEAARKHSEALARLSGPHLELKHWLQFVSAVLTEKHADWIGIMVHWYSGNVMTEPLAASNRRWLNLSDLTEEYLLNADEDMLHTITLKPIVA